MAALSMAVLPSAAQKNGITDTGKSKYAVVSSTPLSAVRWTGGFWGERFGVFSGKHGSLTRDTAGTTSS